MPLPGTKRFKVTTPKRWAKSSGTGPHGHRSLGHGFMSLEEARAWAEKNAHGPYEIYEYRIGSKQDPDEVSMGPWRGSGF
jgi:hypothetical protein